MGYRWYDAQGRAPHFAFGFGLSYSTFAAKFDGAVVGAVSLTSNATVRARVSLESGPAGKLALQLYVAFPPQCDEPPQRLVAFKKVAVAPGASADVEFTLTAADLAIFDVRADAFLLCAETGYELRLAASSRDVRDTAPLDVTR